METPGHKSAVPERGHHVIAVNRASTSLVLTLEDEAVGTEAVSSHGLVSHFLWVLLGGTSFPAVLLHVGG